MRPISSVSAAERTPAKQAFRVKSGILHTDRHGQDAGDGKQTVGSPLQGRPIEIRLQPLLQNADQKKALDPQCFHD
jgi:hypothetical protein